MLLKLLGREAYTLRVAVIQAAGTLVEKTSQPRDRDPANGISSGTNGTASGTGGTGEGRRASGYGAVTNKRASIVIRRQSLAAGKEKEKEEGKEEEEPAIQSIDLKTAVRIIGLIEERQHDVNAFVRSAALRVLVSLVEGGFVPLSKFLSVTRVAAERLQDKGYKVLALEAMLVRAARAAQRR